MTIGQKNIGFSLGNQTHKIEYLALIILRGFKIRNDDIKHRVCQSKNSDSNNDKHSASTVSMKCLAESLLLTTSTNCREIKSQTATKKGNFIIIVYGPVENQVMSIPEIIKTKYLYQ